MMDNLSLKQIANALAAETTEKILRQASDPAYAASLLQDMKLIVARKAAEISGWDMTSPQGMDVVWNIAHNMPDFSMDIFSSRRMSAISLASAVLLGWFLGGLCSGLLNLVNMGGDILRPLAIFLAVLSQDYFAVNGSARKYFLKIFGWTALAGVAARICSGMLRFGTGIRAIFPTGSRASGIFRSFWLILGVAVIFVLFSGKRGKPDKDLSQKALAGEIEARLTLLKEFFAEIADREKRLRTLADDSQKTTGCDAGACELAAAVMEIMDSLTDSQKAFLLRKLQKQGFRPIQTENQRIAWDGEKHGKLYETLGFVKDGDACLVLKKPVEYNGVIIKGLAQRLD